MRGRFARVALAAPVLCAPFLLIDCSHSVGETRTSNRTPTHQSSDDLPPTEPVTGAPAKPAPEQQAVARAVETDGSAKRTKAPSTRVDITREGEEKATAEPSLDALGSAGLALKGVGQGGGGSAQGFGRAVARPRIQVAAPRLPGSFNTEAYAHVQDNAFASVVDAPLSTFAIDVDTASYANVRRFLRDGSRPPADAVRIEELVNYFSYDYPEPEASKPFSVTTEVSACPWQPKHRLVHIGLKGKSIERTEQKPKNLVFLIDVSGSMQSHDKLPLLRRGLELLVNQLGPRDRIAIAVYAGASGLALASTPGSRKNEILSTLHSLKAGGSTNGAQGIELAYQVAQKHFVKNGVNRVILATDGDFNVGVTSQGELQRLIEQKRRSGVFLTVLGFGRGNLKDSTMETLADKGNGNYAYIDSLSEARKVLVKEAGATLETIAKDVKIQVEFNPKHVKSYRLIGYENRMLKARDFNDDRKDAGEIGAGHTVTALYEVVPASGTNESEVDALKYQSARTTSKAAQSQELLTVKLRYKPPSASRSHLLTHTVQATPTPIASTSADYRFSAAVAAFGMMLRDSEHRGTATLPEIRRLAAAALGKDPNGLRRQLLAMIDRASELGFDDRSKSTAQR